MPDPLGDLVARYARAHGPFTAAAWRTGTGSASRWSPATLHRLTAEGRVVEGEFLPGGRGTEWCDTGVLRLLRRRCLARLRKEAEPVPPQALARSCPPGRTRRTGRGDRGPGEPGRRRPAGPDAVYAVVEQLAGAAVPASALETLVLPGRVPGYSPAMLDELTAAGEVVWAGAGALPGGDGWLVLAPADAAPLLFRPPGEITMTPVHEAVLDGAGRRRRAVLPGLADRVDAQLRRQGPRPARPRRGPGAR